MSRQGDILMRIEEVEAELRGVSREVRALRVLAEATPVVTTDPSEQERPSAAPTVVRRPPERVTSAGPTPRAAATTAPRPAPSPPPPGRTIGDLARDWDLLGPRGFAVVGGAVTALGVILLFVLAANRGWITPGMRVAFGAVVSASAVGAGFWVRRRYGQMQTSLGAVGAGIAGGYASLAAATAHYDLVPNWLALPLASLIAVFAVLIALAWDSEIVAGIGLLGSALAPALQALDSGLDWVSVAFAVIVLAGTVAVSAPRSWHRLLVAIAAVVTAQAAWLAAACDRSADAGTTAVEASLVLVLLAAGILLQLRSGATELDRLATAFVLAPVGLALGVAQLLYVDGPDLGIALAVAAAVWAAAWAALRRLRQPDLALVLGISSLTLAAVASVYLLAGTSLTVTWAAQSLLLSALAWRLRDARLQLMSLAYLALSAAYVSLVDVPPWTLFEDPVVGAAAISVAAVALAAAVAGLLAPAETAQRTEAGLLAWIAPLRAGLMRCREGLRAGLVFAGAATGTYAAALALVSISYRPGHLAATIVASAVGAIVSAVAARRGSVALVAAGVAWLGVVLLVAAAFDVPEFAHEAVSRSYGGWALLAAAAGLLAGCYAVQLLFQDPKPPVKAGAAGLVALAAATAGIALISPPGDVLISSWIGWRLLIPAFVYFGLAAGAFRSERHRDLSTWMWVLGTAALLGAETLVVDDATLTVIAYAATATALALLAAPLREERLWFAGTAIVSATSAVVLAWFVPPSHFFAATAAPGAGLWAGLGCLGAGIALHLTGARYRRSIDPILGIGALYLVSLAILELAQRLFGGSVETDFERGQVVLSVVWALIGLALLVAGLLRGEPLLRYGGLALFGLSLAKIFLYDLSALSSVARALSFITVGALVLAGGFFLQRLDSHIDSRRPHTP